MIDVCVGGATGYAVTIPNQNEVAPTIVAGACPGG